MKSVMTHQFSQVPAATIPRSTFDRSHGHKTTFDAGYLVPIFCDEALPGDTFNCNLSAFARLATPIFPVMDNMFMDTFFFSVPVRLLWDNWKKFNGEQLNPGDSIDYLVPQIVSPTGGYQPGSIFDYMGLPVLTQGVTHSALWNRAYNLIWNEWFRDENLQAYIANKHDDGPDPVTAYALMRRGKRHDYFTSCLPWPQKGAAVTLPLGMRAPVAGPFNVTTQGGLAGGLLNSASATAPVNVTTPQAGSQSGWWSKGNTGDNTTPNGLFADLSQATSATINSLRMAFQVQRLLERDARGGTRYTELIRSHFGVTSPDARLQRPEYLGGGSTPVNISPVPQTAPTTAAGETPQGNLAAFGTVGMHNHAFTASFTEHCILIGLVSVRADLTYQQGLNRMWSRRTRYDFYLPALSHIGEQAVLQ